MAQPVVDEPVALVFQRGAHAAATIVADDNDVLDLEYVDGELHHRQTVEVARYDHIRNVAMHEDFARVEAGDLVGRHAAVGAAYPEIFRVLLIGEATEIAWVFSDALFRPGAIVIQQMVEWFRSSCGVLECHFAILLETDSPTP